MNDRDGAGDRGGYGSGDRDRATRAAQDPVVHGLRLAPREQRPALLMASLRAQIARQLCLEVSDVEPRSPLMRLGMTSLQAVDIKTHWEKELGLPLRSTLLFDYPTLEALVPYLLGRLALDGTHSPHASEKGGAA